METISEKLVGLTDRSVEARDLSRAAVHLLDWLGTVLSARNSSAAEGLTEGAGGLQAALGTTGSPETAAFRLGALGNVMEMDDLHRASILHAGDTVWASTLASGLRHVTDGPTLLRAALDGYEVALRVGLAAARGGYSNWFNSGTCGVYGAAAASARLLNLSAAQTTHAIGHAGMQAAGLWQCRLEPGDGKQLATAHAARAGVTSAMLALAGARGPREIFEGKLGFFATYYPEADPQELLANPYADWLLHDVSLKPWSACRHTHPAIAAALDLRADGLDPGHIVSMTLHTYEAALNFCDAPAPTTAHEARFSLQTALAVALSRGAPRIADFEDATRRDAPMIVALRNRITLAEDPTLTAAFPKRYAARLEVQTTSGETLTAGAPHAPGDPEVPLSEAEITDKFLSNADYGAVPDGLARSIAEAVLTLPNARDLSAVQETLAQIPVPIPKLRSTA